LKENEGEEGGEEEEEQQHFKRKRGTSVSGPMRAGVEIMIFRMFFF